MADITHKDLGELADRIEKRIDTVRSATESAVRHEVQLLRNESQRVERGIHRRMDSIDQKQDEHSDRITKLEAITESGQVSHTAQRMSRTKKAGIWSLAVGAGGFVYEIVRQIVASWKGTP